MNHVESSYRIGFQGEHADFRGKQAASIEDIRAR